MSGHAGMTPAGRLDRLLGIHGGERAAVWLAAGCNFVLLASYYLLRPLRDVMATVYGAENLQYLYTGTFVLMLAAAPLYAALASRIRLDRFLPGVFWFWLGNILLFHVLFPDGTPPRWLAAAYYWWFSVANLYMIAVFWSLMVDTFSATQASRVFAFIAASGSVGAIAGPLLTRRLVGPLGANGLLLVAAGGFLVVVGFVHGLVVAKRRLHDAGGEAQASTLDHSLRGNMFAGFSTLFRSSMLRWQALFMLLMTWVATIAYYFQTDFIQSSFTTLAERTRAIADIDLYVNIAAALVAIVGTGPILRRFGVTLGLLLNPIMLVFAFTALLLSPTVVAIQALQVVRRAGQYAIARPCREVCFTVVPQETRYKAKAVIDTAVYRLGDLTAIWLQALLRWAGHNTGAIVGMGIGVSALWGAVALVLGFRYEGARRGLQGRQTGQGI